MSEAPLYSLDSGKGGTKVAEIFVRELIHDDQQLELTVLCVPYWN